MKQFLLVAGVLISFQLSAQFELSAELRPRGEFRNGYSRMRDSLTTPAFFVSQRSRVNMHYKKDKYSTQLSLQDVRVWGDEALKKDMPSVSIQEAWFKYDFNDLFSLKLGRQNIGYDDSRLISAVDWNQNSAKHDALLLSYKKNDFNIDFVSAYNQAGMSTFGTDYSSIVNHYKTLNILWLSKTWEKASVSLINILDGYQSSFSPDILYARYTGGPVLKFQPGKLLFELRFFQQYGQKADGQKVNAYFSNIIAGYKFSESFSLQLGNQFLSGNDMTDTLNLTDNAFDILYGKRHRVNGIMDYFSIPGTTKGVGFDDSYLLLNYQRENYKLFFEYHYFLMANNYVVDNVIADKYLGSEFDLYTKYKIHDDINLEIGYGLFIGTESTELLKGGDYRYLNHYLYTMLTIKPTFFSSKD